METRVIVADNNRARIFSSDSTLKNIEEIEDFVHTAAHLSNQELVDDVAGESVDHHGSLDPASSAKDHEEKMFAKSLGKHLKELYNQQHYEQLILIAPPKFLGLLRNELPGVLEKLVTRTINKDLTLSSVEELLDYLEK